MSQAIPEPNDIIDSEAVVVDIKQYKKLLRLIEKAEDIAYVKSVRDEPTRDYDEYRKRRLKIKTRLRV